MGTGGGGGGGIRLVSRRSVFLDRFIIPYLVYSYSFLIIYFLFIDLFHELPVFLSNVGKKVANVACNMNFDSIYR